MEVARRVKIGAEQFLHYDAKAPYAESMSFLLPESYDGIDPRDSKYASNDFDMLLNVNLDIWAR